MTYEKAMAEVVELENTDVIPRLTSSARRAPGRLRLSASARTSNS